MWHRVAVLVLGIYLLVTMKASRGSASASASNNNNRFNGGTSGILAAGKGQLQLELNAWQPFTQHNNWLILQATAPSSVQPESESSPRLLPQQQQQQQQEQQQQQQQHQRLPVNYYAYANHRYNESARGSISPSAGGNYKQVRAQAAPATTLSDPASYVLAISQSMRRGEVRRQLPVTEEEAEQDVRHAAASTLTNSAHIANNDDVKDADADSSGIKDTEKTAALGINAYLVPFQRALVKVRNFCDSVGALLSDVLDEEEEANGENEQLQLLLADGTSSNKLANTPPVTSTAKIFTSKEANGATVQGRYNHRLALDGAEGRKLKKLKKKIQKLLLPLLIAYKLKFLTLIPVLIGGLTLLVGTTGLAGFFFALFTAVMSLKTTGGGGGHGSKAIVLKKI
ncbi:transcription initiation factor TFIID subunit 12 [Drosophila obscura]|uniref:transcription initiation factor TFIID subunit 12 n=1 Tax=Drosophila obscura TaxID=7282 RepID=UPI001BB2B365|nr:transcription initiation factor TFIID subunit 12 [Drosophila obscura]